MWVGGWMVAPRMTTSEFTEPLNVPLAWQMLHSCAYPKALEMERAAWVILLKGKQDEKVQEAKEL